jgi:hypothetical protein
VNRLLLERENAAQLTAIENALFVVAIDEARPSNASELDMADAGRTFLCGAAANRWYDKSLQVRFCQIPLFRSVCEVS